MSSNLSKNIKAINKEAVHRICSGQVVLNLATAVKELVENSLDAGATVVDIRLREYGSELVEVTDNGVGVESENFQGLTLKHHTSKLQDFSDLISVETFGFRGEALSSLCALSNLTVVTRHSSSECGSRLVFDHNGKITSYTSVARQVGTTVSLENIFSTLPVRQKEFHRNLKREFGKMTQLLYAYCLVSTGVKISCTNQAKKGGRTTVVSTQGCKTVRENIACVFGTKQLSSLLELKEVPPSSEVLEQLNLKDVDVVVSICQLEGMVSSCAHGSGRSTADRQFYYVNSRPCEPSKVIKAVNEVYRQFNMHQQPFVFLNIRSARDAVDVNVTPDKRQVFIEHEKLLVATVKASLQALYENIPSTYTVNNVPAPSLRSASSPSSLPSSSSPLALFSQWRHNGNNKRPSSEQPAEKIPKQAKLDCIFAKKEKRTDFLNGFSKHSSSSSIQEQSSKLCIQNSVSSQDSIDDTNKTQKEDTLISTSVEKGSTEENGDNHIEPQEVSLISPSESTGNSNPQDVTCSDVSLGCVSLNATKIEEFSEKTEKSEILSQSSSLSERDLIEKQDFKISSEVISLSSQTSSLSDFTEDSDQKTYLPLVHHDSSPIKDTSDESIYKNEEEELVPSNSQINIQYDTDLTEKSIKRSSLEVSVTLEDLREYVHKTEEKKNLLNEAKVRFRAIIDPTKNQQAEQELSREISKDMFSKMDIIGQFNLGFIIVKLNSDLFIVDQHATDEKYNFETLQKTTTISNQKLVVPQPLELTAVNEAVLMDNLNVFKANGFEFTIDESAATTSKVKLTSIPISLSWTFGKEDIDELLFMLQDAPNTLCRPSRVRAMFASRACRKSVMIGTALSKADMKRLLVHMGEIEQPWNCPHGRPTMRHLVNLNFM